MARGLMHHPKILFLDEPTLGLDPQTREHIWKYVDDLVYKEKITVIITTHYMDEADKLCDRLAIIDHGKISALDSSAKLKQVVGGDVVVLKTGNPNLENIKKLEFVKNIQTKDNIVSLTVTKAGEHLPEILAAIGKVESVEVYLPTLEDVFLHYTGRAIRETSGEGGWAEKVMAFRAKK